MEMIAIIAMIIGFIYLANYNAKEKERKQEEIREQNLNNTDVTDNNAIKCPKCLSTQISANKRGLTLSTGLIGSQNVYITCLQCGHKWKAGSQ